MLESLYNNIYHVYCSVNKSAYYLQEVHNCTINIHKKEQKAGAFNTFEDYSRFGRMIIYLFLVHVLENLPPNLQNGRAHIYSRLRAD